VAHGPCDARFRALHRRYGRDGRLHELLGRVLSGRRAAAARGPLYPTLGNHEDDQSPFYGTHYFDVFHLPGAERWYAFSYGNARLISLKADGYPIDVYYPGAEQLAWLEEELASTQQPWTFVLMHWGVFTSRGRISSKSACASGSCRCSNATAWTWCSWATTTATSGWRSTDHLPHHGRRRGIPLRPGGPEPGRQAEARAFHFVQVDVSGDRLVGQAIDRRGRVLDRFELAAGR